MKKISIDLGTFNTLCYYSDDFGEIRIIKHKPEEQNILVANAEDEKEMPSFIFIDDDGKICEIGYKAKGKFIEFPMNTIWGIKRLLGKSYMSMLEELDRYSFQIDPDHVNGNCLVNVNGHLFTPSELITALFRQILTDLKANDISLWDEVIVTVPAYYSSNALTEIINAAVIAGFNKDKITTMTEPVAAALAQNFYIQEGMQIKTLVCDIGAGTTDFSVGFLFLEEEALKYKPLKNMGSRFGGLDITDLLVNIIRKKLGLSELQPDLQCEIKKIAELVKIKLTYAEEVDFTIHRYGLSITRDELKKALEPFLAQVEDLIQWACKSAGWSLKEIQHFLIIGGPTISPLFSELFGQIFHENQKVLDQVKAFYNSGSPSFRMNAVALGALKSMNIQDLQSFGYGVELTRFPSEHVMERYPKILIKPNSVFPCESVPLIIPVFSHAGTDLKILQFQSDKEEKTEALFIGVIKFLTRNLFFISELQMQMIINQRRQLIIRISDIYGGKRVYEFESIPGSNTQIQIDYPISHLLPEYHKPDENEYIFGPDSHDLKGLKIFARELYTNLTEKNLELPLRLSGIMHILTSEQEDFYELFNACSNILFNIKSYPALSYDELYELESKLFEFENCLVKEKKSKIK